MNGKKELIIDFVEKTYELSDAEFKNILWQMIEVRLTTKFHRSNKNTYKDLDQVFKEYDNA